MATNRKPISAKTRYEVLRRDAYTCQSCGGKAPNVTLQVDHVKAVAKGGGDGMENLRAICVTCNLGKGDGDVEIAQVAQPQEPGKHPLVGWSFLSYDFKDGREVVSKQGTIKAVVATNTAQGDLAIVDYFEWFTGGYSYSGAIPLTEFSRPWGQDGFYKLFATWEERKDYYDWKHGRGHEDD